MIDGLSISLFLSIYLNSEIHDLKFNPAFAPSQNCIDRQHLEQLHKETNEICSGGVQSNQLTPIPSSSNQKNLPPIPTSPDNIPSSAQLSYLTNQVQVMNGQMKNVTKGVASIQWELTEGRLNHVDSSLEKIRVLVDELREELEVKNQEKFDQVLQNRLQASSHHHSDSQEKDDDE